MMERREEGWSCSINNTLFFFPQTLLNMDLLSSVLSLLSSFPVQSSF